MQTLKKYGMEISVGEAKTAILVFAKRTEGSPVSSERSSILLRPHVPVLLEDSVVRLPLVANYKHLGGIVDVGCSFLPEIRARFTKAKAAFWRAAKRVFRNRILTVEIRYRIFSSTVLSIMNWGIGTWTGLSLKEHHAYVQQFGNCMSLCVPSREANQSRHGMTFAAYYSAMTPEDILHVLQISTPRRSDSFRTGFGMVHAFRSTRLYDLLQRIVDLGLQSARSRTLV